MMAKKPTCDELEQRVKALEEEIVQQKKAAKSLLEIEKDKYNKLINDSNDAIIIAQGIELKLANKAAFRMWGYQNVGEVAGLQMTDVISPKDLELILKRSAAREKGENAPSRYEFRALHKDGTEFLAELSVSRILYQGQVARQAVIKDITEQRRTEEALRKNEKKYKLLADNVTDVICVVNLDKLKFEYVSPSIKSILGYTVEELIDFNIYDLLLPYSADLVLEAIAQELEKDKSGKAEPQLLELDIVRKDGLKVCFGVSARFLRDNKEHVTSVLCVARDISERKKAGAALKESEERYRLLADNVSDMIWTMDMNFNYTYVSPSITNMLGFSVEEALARTVEESITPASFNNAMEILAEELELHTKGQAPPGRSKKIKNELFCKDGSTVWTEAKVTFLYDATGQPQGIVGVTRDITERKQAEEVLRTSEVKHKTLVKNIPGMIYRAYPDWSAEIISGSETVCGYNKKELIDKENNWLNIIHPDDKEKVLKAGYQMIHAQKDIIQTYRIKTKEGDIRWVEDRKASIFSEKGEFVGIDGVVFDITERKNAEEALRDEKAFTETALNAQQDTFFLFEPATGKAIRWNRAFNDITGYTDEEIAEMVTPDSYYSPKDLERVSSSIQNIMETGTDTIELELIRKDGRKVPTEYKVSAIKDEEGKPKYFISIGRDITDRKRAEKELLKAKAELEEKVKERTAEIQERNIALKVLLGQREGDKKKLEASIMSNVKELLMPNLSRLKNSMKSSEQKIALNVLEANLNEIISPFAGNKSSLYMKLTPTEIQVANFIKHGATSKNIAESLCLSQRTIDTHRYNIRKKIGISGRDTNLRTYLLAMT